MQKKSKGSQIPYAFQRSNLPLSTPLNLSFIIVRNLVFMFLQEFDRLVNWRLSQQTAYEFNHYAYQVLFHVIINRQSSTSISTFMMEHSNKCWLSSLLLHKGQCVLVLQLLFLKRMLTKSGVNRGSFRCGAPLQSGYMFSCVPKWYVYLKCASVRVGLGRWCAEIQISRIFSYFNGNISCEKITLLLREIIEHHISTNPSLTYT